MPKLLPSIENAAEEGCTSNQVDTSTVLGINVRDYQSGSTSSIRLLEDQLKLYLKVSLSLTTRNLASSNDIFSNDINVVAKDHLTATNFQCRC
jgi:hypothetical protein